MSLLTIEDLKGRSKRSPSDMCWHWQGAAATDGTPRLWTLDYDRLEKRSMSGAKAIYYIAFERPLNGKLAYRGCFCTDCVNPAHIRTALTKADIGRAVRASGVRKGTAMVARRANLAIAHAANGIVPTSLAIVLAIREAPATVTGRALALTHGISSKVVSRIRRGQSHREAA